MSQQMHTKPKSKVTLIIGLICLAIAAVAGVFGYLGMTAMSAGAESLMEQSEGLVEDDPNRVSEELNVPGDTVCQLRVDDYIIWATQPVVADQSADADAAADENSDAAADEFGFNDDDFEDYEHITYSGPEITWKIDGPSGEIRTRKDNILAGYSGNQIAIAGFSITEAGEYTINGATDGDLTKYSFDVYDDIAAEEMEEFSENFGETAGGLLKMIGGFLAAALFGLIGMIMMIVFLVSK